MNCPDSFTVHGVTFRKVRDDGPNAATYQAEDLGTQAARVVERANLERAANELQRLASDQSYSLPIERLRKAIELAGAAIMALRQ